MAEITGIVLGWMILLPLVVVIVRFWFQVVMSGIGHLKTATGGNPRQVDA